MSKHWRPDEDFARARFGAGGRQRLPQGGTAGLVLVAAACMGVAFGIHQAFAPHEPVAPGAQAAGKPVPGANALLTRRR